MDEENLIDFRYFDERENETEIYVINMFHYLIIFVVIEFGSMCIRGFSRKCPKNISLRNLKRKFIIYRKILVLLMVIPSTQYHLIEGMNYDLNSR